MNPEQLLGDVMTSIWGFIVSHDFLYFAAIVAIVVIICKVIKASFKTILKIVGVMVAIFIVKQIFGI